MKTSKKLTLEELKLEVPVLSLVLTRGLLGGGEYGPHEPWDSDPDSLKDGGYIGPVDVSNETPPSGTDIGGGSGNGSSGGNNNEREQDDRDQDDDRDTDNDNDNEANNPNGGTNGENQSLPTQHTISGLRSMPIQPPNGCVFSSTAFILNCLNGNDEMDPIVVRTMYHILTANPNDNIPTDNGLNGVTSWAGLNLILEYYFTYNENPTNVKSALALNHFCIGIMDDSISDNPQDAHAVVIVGYDERGCYSYVDPYDGLIHEAAMEIREFYKVYEITGKK
jgi:hypothetical protein